MKALRRAGVSAAWLAVFGISGVAFAAPDRLTTEIDSGSTVALNGALNPQLRQAVDTGRLDPATRIENVTIHFRRSPQQQAELDALLQQQHLAGSPAWHQWLTPEQFGERFGVGSADLQRVQRWLEGQGLEVGRIPSSRNQISFSGSVAQIERALGVELHRYRYDGETHFASAVEPRLPAALDGMVLGVRNLDDFRPKPRLKASKVEGSNGPSPRLTTGSGTHLLSPDDIATIYDIQPLYQAKLDGTSVTIAVIGQTQVNLKDIEAFRTAAHLPKNDPVPVLANPSSEPVAPTSPDDLIESDLDLEWAGAVAYGAGVKFVYTDSPNYNVFDALTYAIQNNEANIITMSYGSCEPQTSNSDISSMQSYAQQANSQGQTIIVASGDSGAAGCDAHSSPGTPAATHGLAVDFPADLAEITGVGGTTLVGDTNPQVTYWQTSNNSKGGSALSYIPEAVWDDLIDPGLNASGGGVSTAIAKPAYQVGLTPLDGARDVPDVSFNADATHDPYLICTSNSCLNGTFGTGQYYYVAGGTSASAPVFAGILALLERSSGSAGEGNFNTVMYSLASTSSYATAFHDIVSGGNTVYCAEGTPDCPLGTVVIGYTSTTGYDLASGLGSMDVYATAQALGINPKILTSTALAIAPNRVQLNGSTTLTATITPQTQGADAVLGTVQFSLDGTNLGGPVTVTNKQATLKISLPELGIHTIAASYQGYSEYAVSQTSGTVSVLALPPAQDSKDGGGGALPPLMLGALAAMAGWRRRRVAR